MPEDDAHWVLFRGLKPDQISRLKEILERKRREAAEAVMLGRAAEIDEAPSAA